MSRFNPLSLLAIHALCPGKMRLDVKGGAIEGGRNSYGESQAIELSGGGIVSVGYDDLWIYERAQFEYLSALGARLNNSVRNIVVPIMTEFLNPVMATDRTIQPYVRDIMHSDGSLFSDGTGYSQATVTGRVAAAAALNAGKIKLTVLGNDRPLAPGHWFSILHPTKGHRAYRIWDMVSISDDANPVYEAAISPPLREAVTGGEDAELARPRFTARFPAGFSLPIEAEDYWLGKSTIEFVEAF